MMQTGNPGGGYILVLEVTHPATIQVGKLGVLRVRPGRYYYGGSARRGITGRVTRHYRADKNVYWHIDYLTVHPAVTLTEAWCFPGHSAVEHHLPQLNKVVTDDIPRGLGAGDCTHGCHSHLVRGLAPLTPNLIAPEYYVLDAGGDRSRADAPDAADP